jgi:hypothetical protein
VTLFFGNKRQLLLVYPKVSGELLRRLAAKGTPARIRADIGITSEFVSRSCVHIGIGRAAAAMSLAVGIFALLRFGLYLSLRRGSAKGGAFWNANTGRGDEMYTLLLTLSSLFALCALYGLIKFTILMRDYRHRRREFDQRMEGRAASSHRRIIFDQRLENRDTDRRRVDRRTAPRLNTFMPGLS